MKLRLNYHFSTCVVIAWLVFFIVLFMNFSMAWIHKHFARVNLDEIALIMQIGTTGVDSGLLSSFIKGVVRKSLIWSTVLAAVCYFMSYYKYIYVAVYVVLFVLLVYRTAVSNFQFVSFFQVTSSDFYEKEYVDLETARINFKNKRNVLFIVLESMEKQYADEEMFGTGGLTPNLTKLAKKNVSFDRYNSLLGTNHTIAAITGMVSGLPLFFSSFQNVEKMLGASGVGTIFKNNGYQTWSMFPASGTFSLKSNYLQRMGFDNIYDGHRLRKMLDHEIDVKPFGGVDDANLFKVTKPIISEIIKSKQPYFILMETINTHCDGYYTQACRDMGFAQENQEDIAKCEDKIIYDFIRWFRQQDPNAVVVLVDDHAQHTGGIMKKLRRAETRNLENIFINTNLFSGVDTKRPIMAFDICPTLVEVAGAEIEGCRLGLGTSLTKRCANVPTLRERFEDKELENIMKQKNKLYYYLATGKGEKK